MGELPGHTGRRWIPEGGLQKHRDRIHRESKQSDKHGNLPFKFSKPTKPKKHEWFVCTKCEKELSLPRNTYMCVCPECKKLIKVERIE
jgi:hypothetical protein